MQSDQERLLALYSRKSMGGPYLFAPDEWKKGGAVREPADLAWVCNGCAVLMYMCGKDPQTEPLKIERARHKASQHNINQSAGWLREWRKGRSLTGRNEYGRFDVPYTSVQHIVVLSIVSCSGVLTMYHQETLDLGVTLCATVARSVMELFAETGTSTLDLVDFVNHLRSQRVTWGESEALNQVRNYVSASLASAGLTFTPGNNESQKFGWGLSTILSSRGFKPHSSNDLTKLVQNNIGEGGGAAVLNDISLPDLYKVVALFLQQVDHMTADGSETWFQIVNLAYYSYGVCIVPSFGSSQVLEQTQRLTATWKDMLSQGQRNEGHVIIYELNGISMTLVEALSRESHTKLFLDKCRIDQLEAEV